MGTTPGPWYAERNKVFRDTPEAEGGPYTDTVAICLGDIEGNSDHNAALIAKAPEMRDELEHLRWRDSKVELPPEDYDGWVGVIIDFHSVSCMYPGNTLGTYDHREKHWRTQFTWCKPHWVVTHWCYRPDAPAGPTELEGEEG